MKDSLKPGLTHRLFSVCAHDGIDSITAGTHERHVIDVARFSAKVAEKARRAGAGQ